MKINYIKIPVLFAIFRVSNYKLLSYSGLDLSLIFLSHSQQYLDKDLCYRICSLSRSWMFVLMIYLRGLLSSVNIWVISITRVYITATHYLLVLAMQSLYFIHLLFFLMGCKSRADFSHYIACVLLLIFIVQTLAH